MKTLDKFDIILRDAKPSFVIMGNLDVTEYDFVSQDRLPASDEALDSYRQRGMGFLGVTGLVGGSPRTALAVPLDAPAIETLVTALVEILSTRLREGDPDLTALYELWALPDTRPIC